MRFQWLSQFVFLISIAVTLLATFTIRNITMEREKARFNHSADQLQRSVASGLNKYLTLLDSVRAMAVAKVSMNPTQFRSYVDALNLRENYHGVKGLGVALKIASSQKAEMIEKVREQGIRDFRIWPESDRPEICPLVILEPLDQQNSSALGYDLFAEPERRAAANAAMENGSATATAKIAIDQETSASKEEGFVILVPIYREGGLPETIEERRAKISGFVHCAFRSQNLFSSIVGQGTNVPVTLRIHDGSVISNVSLIYESPGWTASPDASEYTSTNRLTVAGRQWTILFASQPHFRSGINPALATLLGGTVLSVLLWRIAAFQSQARESAERHALEMQRSERALRESEARRLQAETLSSIMVTHIGLDGSLMKVPPTLLTLLGYEQAERQLRFFEAITHPEDREAEKGLRETLLTGTNKSADIEMRLLAQNGDSIWVAVHYSLVTDEGGKPLYFLTYIQDVSERKRYETEIRDINVRLEQRVAERTAELEATVEELKSFSYSVSHDLRAPLRHIDGYVSLLNECPTVATDEMAQQFSKTITKATRRMGQLIDALLNFSQIGRVSLSIEPQVDVNELVKEVCQMLAPEIEKRAVEWRIADLPQAAADRTLLRQVFANLMSNAVKYTRNQPLAVIEIGSEDRDQEIVYFVRDNGVGFDMSHADKLFGVFQRLHRNDEFEGIGIGLANIRKIVTRHGGRTWAESQLGQGATFYFTLPKMV